jgi:hypothetical protein
MRTKSFIPLLGFILLFGAVSCTESIEVNPNFNPETKEVTTQFVLSVNTGSPQTKMTSTNVQRANNFLGIDNAHVMAFKTGMSKTDFSVEPFILKSDLATDRDFELGTLFSNGSINAGTNATASSNRIVQLNVPVDVDAILFYGKAINATPGSATGRMSYNVSSTPSASHFDLIQRLENETNYKHTGDLLVFILNRIISSSIPDMPASETYTAPGDPADPKTQYTGLPALSWKDLGAKYDDPTLRPSLSGLEEILGAAYSTFTAIESGEYRAGSSAAVKSMMTSLIDVVKTVQGANPTSNLEANACRLADEIMQRKGRYFTDAMEYQGLSSIKANVIANSASTGIADAAAWDAKFSGVTDVAGFPHTQFLIPEGAAQLNYVATTGKFEYLDPNQALANPGNEFNPNNYLYPAELAYYVNSPIRTTNKDVTTADYPNGVNPWDDDTSSGNKWTANSWQINSRVQSNTRGIAVRNNINYGVALLETKVAIASGISNFKDNKVAKTGDANPNLIPTDNHHLTLTGILVGGQINTVDWQFLPKVTTGSEFTYVVYDDAIASSTIPTPTGSENYTLVLDNYNKTLGDDAQSSVRVALEFKNEGDPFWGKDNIVPKDGFFYLIAELPVATATSASVLNLPVWPDDGKYAIPPVYGIDSEAVPSGKVAGHSKKINRVFIQNFVTSATFTLGEESLKNAYVTVPNLSSTQMSLGLSVDLKWHTGYTYNIGL